jgi:hypothetical protein
MWSEAGVTSILVSQCSIDRKVMLSRGGDGLVVYRKAGGNVDAGEGERRGTGDIHTA